MKITFIGTGSAFNHDYGNNSAFLEFGDTNLLLDCGHDVPRNFEKLYDNVSKIDNIWISHMHGDHIGGLEEIAFKNKFIYGGKMVNLLVDHTIHSDLVMYLQKTIVSPQPGLSNVSDFFNIHGVVNGFAIESKDSKEVFYTQQVPHVCGVPAFMIVGRKFIFTGDVSNIDWGDSQYSKLIKHRVCFHDTQLQKFSDDDVHMSLQDLLKLPKDIRAKMHCMHYGINIDDYVKTIEEAGMRIVRPGDIIKLY